MTKCFAPQASPGSPVPGRAFDALLWSVDGAMRPLDLHSNGDGFGSGYNDSHAVPTRHDDAG